MKVLFLTDYFFPNGSPNGNCVKDVAHEFKVNGHEVYVLGFKGYNENVVQLEYPVYKLKPICFVYNVQFLQYLESVRIKGQN